MTHKSWIKKGRIFKPERNNDWMVSHASIPVADKIEENVLRIYFASRDDQGRSRPGYIHVEADNPSNILYVHDRPLLPLGRRGTFDDNGIMPSWLVHAHGKQYLYYIGWNPQVTVSYRLSIGLAISHDGGATFQKWSDGPICDRSIDEPYFNTAPCVHFENGVWKMWYVSCTKWEMINDWPEPFYNIKFAESSDGIHWNKTGLVCIEHDEFSDAIGRPAVFQEDGIYKMLYSFRNAKEYRTNPHRSYRLGYAESADGTHWIRKDHEVGIERSRSGWDSTMMEYCFPYIHRGKKYLFYNGNGFGLTGFGYAIRDQG